MVLLQDSFSRGSQRGVRMSESQISAVIAAVHNSLKVNKVRDSSGGSAGKELAC